MGKRVQRVPLHLDTRGIKSLPQAEIAAILRGADEMILRGGRTLLAQLLKGSRRKKLLELELDKSPVFGFYRQLREEEILARIDWTILQGYLEIEYDYRLPLLVFGRKGWEIEKQTYAEELLQRMRSAAAGGSHFDPGELKDRNRELIWLLLEKIEAAGDAGLIPMLRAWSEIDYKKVRTRIARVIHRLESA
ncbi:RQC-minor-1 family DNA-binding protein [Microbulbifer sp.]|uniref:RQC-minor-1 family DNA-binding protein n=1 Tax=Microbulbifer sp. TaxID=1908541 RepID=UPI003F3489FF